MQRNERGMIVPRLHPLAFAVGILTSLLFPEKEAAERFAEVEQRLHLGADL